MIRTSSEIVWSVPLNSWNRISRNFWKHWIILDLSVETQRMMGCSLPRNQGFSALRLSTKCAATNDEPDLREDLSEASLFDSSEWRLDIHESSMNQCFDMFRLFWFEQNNEEKQSYDWPSLTTVAAIQSSAPAVYRCGALEWIAACKMLAEITSHYKYSVSETSWLQICSPCDIFWSKGNAFLNTFSSSTHLPRVL